MTKNPLCSMRHCIMKGYNDIFQEKASMFSEHLRDGDLINDSYMHDAARFNNIFALELLLEKGCIDPSRQNIGGNTPLHVAAYCGNNESVKMLLKNQSDPSISNEKGELPLHRALAQEHIETVKLLLPVSDVNTPSRNCMTALHTACRLGNLPLVKLLLENGAELILLSNKSRAVLHYAAISGDLPTIAFLIKSGVSVRSVDMYNKTPLQVAFKPQAILFLSECQQVADNEEALLALCETHL